MAPELGFSNVFFKLNYDGNFSPVEDVEFVKRETGLKYVSRAEYLEHEGKSSFLYLRLSKQMKGGKVHEKNKTAV